MKLTKEEKEIESLYEAGRISAHKPTKAMLRKLAMPRDKQEDLRRAVVLGIRSAEAGDLHDMSDSLKREIKIQGRLRRTNRGVVMGVNKRIDRSKIAAAIRADRDAR